jgi:hypothetical protein
MNMLSSGGLLNGCHDHGAPDSVLPAYPSSGRGKNGKDGIYIRENITAITKISIKPLTNSMKRNLSRYDVCIHMFQHLRIIRMPQ